MKLLVLLLVLQVHSIQDSGNCLNLRSGSNTLQACTSPMQGSTQKIWAKASFAGHAYLIEVKNVILWSSNDLIHYCQGAVNMSPFGECHGWGNAKDQLVPVPSGPIATTKYGADTNPTHWTRCWVHSQTTFRIRWTKASPYTQWYSVNSDNDVMVGVIAGCWTP
jgi:hypothetical protein